MNETTIDKPTITVELTDAAEFHCFKIIFLVPASTESNVRVPIEIFLHATQALNLLNQLGFKFCEYLHRETDELLVMKTRQFEHLGGQKIQVPANEAEYKKMHAALSALKIKITKAEK